MGDMILAIDQGTTSSRAVIVDRGGVMLATAQKPISSAFRHPGWVEQDADEIWRVTLEVAREAIARSGVQSSDIAAVGRANQRETTILWDRATGAPLAPAIVWQSRQSAPLVEALRARGMEDRYRAVTGLVPDAYFSATKIAWLLDQHPELRARAAAGEVAFGTIDSFLVWRLTGGGRHVMDVSNASRTMLWDLRMAAWSDELLADLAIPCPVLPEVVGNSEPIGETDAALLGSAVPIMGSAGDQQAALFGQACFEPGQAKNTYGTGSFLLLNTGLEPVASNHRMLTTVAWKIDGVTTYALEGSIFVTGSAIQWLRDGLGVIESAPDVDALASSVPDAGGVAFVPALVGLGAPHWDQDARGLIAGITRGTTAAHIARATLEAIAFQSRDVLVAMAQDSGRTLSELRVDGGATGSDLLMQIQSDVLGVPVVRPAVRETTVMGAAFLAGLAAGVWSGRDEIAALWRQDRRFEPRWTDDERQRAVERWDDAVSRTLTEPRVSSR